MTLTWNDYTRNSALVANASGTIVPEKLSDISPPAGMIVMWYNASQSPPKGWKFCDGGTYSINGTSVTVPNMAGKMPLGGGPNYDTTDFLPGTKTHTLVATEMPSHSHTYNRYNLNAGRKCEDGWWGNPPNHSVPDNVASWRKDKDTSAIGDGKSHNNMPPYQVVQFIIKVDE